MEIINARSVPTMKNPHGVQASKLYDEEHGQAMHILLEPDQSLRRHITPVDVFFYVLEGNGRVEIGEEQQDVQTDMLIKSPAGIPHCWHNTSNNILRILVVKMPRQREKTQILE